MNPIKLNVTHMYQWNSDTWQGHRMCQSSSIAMVALFLKPKLLPGSGQFDDRYLNYMNKFGDTTVGAKHEAALRNLGFTSAEFRTNLTEADLHEQLENGIPIPVGIWIRGHITSNLQLTGGGGHYVVIVGRTKEGNFLVHDPNGTLDIVRGGYKTNLGGKFEVWKREHFLKRWTNSPNGGYGWGHIIENGPQPSVEKAPESKHSILITKIKGKIEGRDITTYLLGNDSFVMAKELDPQVKVVDWIDNGGNDKTVFLKKGY